MRLIFTDLDGTLIDHHTYSADAARPALDAARRAAVAVVPCSSKTLAEMQALARRLDLAPAPLIAENGGAVWFPDAWPVPASAVAAPGGGRLVVLGTPAGELRSLLDGVAAAVGVDVRGFSQMTDDEVAHRTGLPPDIAALARRREYSEPFVCLDGTPDLHVLDRAATAVGTRVTRGGRFWHLTGPSDKGAAVHVVRATCPPGTRTLGIGDAPNDLSLLRAVDDAAIVAQPAGVHDDLRRALPEAVVAAVPGPAGWNAVVLDWLEATASHA